MGQEARRTRPHQPYPALRLPFRPALQAAMEALAGAIPAGQIGRVCYKLYEHFRPAWGGWGAKGALSLSGIRGLAKTWRQQA